MAGNKQKEELSQAARAVRAVILNELKGNAPNITNLSVVAAQEKNIKGRAYTKFTLDTDVSQITQPGQSADGQVVPNQAAANKAIKAVAMDRSPHMRETLRQSLISRADKGFGLSGRKITIPLNQPDIIVHSNCNACNGQGGALCPTCRGQGQMHCPACRGRRQQPCPMCRGQGQVNSQKGNKPCAQCAGRGHTTCARCRGSGSVACTNCRQAGKMPCRECNSTGQTSEIFKIQLIASTFFELENSDESSMPEIFKKSLEENTSAMLSSGILRVSPLTDNASSGRNLDEQELEIGYNFEMQYGEMTFSLNGHDFVCAYAPKNEQILNCPPFLEQFGAGGITNLHKAAKAPPMQTEGLVREAAKFKFIRELVYVRSKNKMARAIKKMATVHRYGLHPGTIQGMATSLNKVFYDLSRAGRIKGLLGGLSASLVLNMLYFLTPSRAMILGATPSALKETLCDLCVFGLAVTLNMTLIKLIGKTSLNRSLSDIIGQKISVRASHLPYGKTRLMGVFGNIVLFAGTYYLALILGRISSSVVMRIIYQ
ncbi:MAG: hypothetical protein CL565_02310 [Alphaproteobacteria bacterium]|nr:hypothetical protein [Alphaproteobacteria bacterium]